MISELELKNELLTPILKWGGGKRQLLNEILPLVPVHTKYYEPFVGGAAVLLGLQPERAVINDYNNELINTYKVVRNDPDILIELLRGHKEKHSSEYYYEVRSWDRDFEGYQSLSDAEKAQEKCLRKSTEIMHEKMNRKNASAGNITLRRAQTSDIL